MSVEFAILFPIAGLITLVFTFAVVAAMIHYMYPRQKTLASAKIAETSIWVEALPEQDVSARENTAGTPAREFIQIRRVNP